MYKYIVYILLLASSVFCQQFTFVYNAEVGIVNKNQEYLLGSEINLLYKINEKIDFGPSFGASITSLEGKLGNQSGYIANLGLLLVYYPFNTNIRPFMGGSIVYNFNFIEAGGLSPFGSSKLHNDIGYKIIFGIQNKLKEYLKLNIGLKYQYQNPTYSFDPYDIEIMNSFRENYEISSLDLFISLVLII
jgi:outer membrane protein W